MRQTLLVSVLLSLGLWHPFSSDAYTRMVDRVSLSIVRVTSEQDVVTFSGTGREHDVCTGIVVQRHLVLTAAHCLGEALQSDGHAVVALSVDGSSDLALLLDTDTVKPALPLSETGAARFESLTAMGYALGLSRLTVLNVRAFLLDTAPYDGATPGLLTQPGFIGGMSGGPIVAHNGQLVGICQQSNSGVGYGVGISTIRLFLGATP